MFQPTLKFEKGIDDLIRLSLVEDDIENDITTDSCSLGDKKVRATIIAKKPAIACGSEVAKRIIQLSGKELSVKVSVLLQDGAPLKENTPWMILEGKASDILKLERTILNFLIRMSGISTAANEIVKIISATGCKLLHTRKTLPGHRQLDIYASVIGGATQHRTSLSDAILVKENHLSAVENFQILVDGINSRRANAKFVEIEVRDFTELKYALLAKPNRIMLDNFSPANCKKAVELFGSSTEFEASGGINPSNALEYAQTGVEFISIGYITHSSPAADLSMLFDYKL